MMQALTASNLATYALQVAVLVALAAVLPRLFRLAAPRARFVYFYLVLAACLLLPLVQPWHAQPAPRVLPTVAEMPLQMPTGSADTAPPGSEVPPSSPRRLPLPSPGLALMFVAAAGIAARLAWLGLGIRGLMLLRRTAAPLEAWQRGIAEAVALAGASADLRATPDVSAPVTFGARHPVVLLPADFASFDPGQQQAVLCHELLHVRRRDWLATLFEELFRSLVWFHPGIWWLVDQIQLSREQVVDEEVVHLLKRRDAYLDALLRLAAPAPQPILRPASLFLRKTHLAQRIALLLKEGPMSARRVVLSLSAIAVILLAGGVLMVQALPLHSAAPELVPIEQQGSTAPALQGGITGGIAPWPHATHTVTPEYPPEALQKGIGGTVRVRMRIEADGSVSAARLGQTSQNEPDPLLARAALAAALQFRFDPMPKAYDDFPVGFGFNQTNRKVEVIRLGPPPPPPPSPPLPAPPAASISGTVVDGSGTALRGALVTIARSSGTMEAQAITDGQGRFSVKVRAPDTYTLTASLTGYENRMGLPAVKVISGQPATARLVLQRR